MFITRHRLSNGTVSIALDAVTGELIEFINLKNGENLIKNFCYGSFGPFRLEALVENGTQIFHCADSLSCKNDPALAAQISGFTDESGEGFRVQYNRLVSDAGNADISVCYTVLLPKTGGETRWHIKVENNSKYTITRVFFPSINGVFLGETWKDDTLIYPMHAGVRLENPVEYLAREPIRIDWKWQEYRYVYLKDSIGHKKESNGCCVLEHKYSGPLSMRWLDLFDNEQGLYFATHDPGRDISALRVESFGEVKPGLNFAVVYETDIASGGSFNSPCHIAAIHSGNWHEGADKYREFKKNSGQCQTVRPPKWFSQSPGLVAHYDFKYQGGGIVHKYRDLPELYKQAKEMGLNHLLLSGWHLDGFDNGFPNYKCDPDLGTEEEFAARIKEIIADNGHVCFYMNSRLFNKKYTELADLRERNEARSREGKSFAEQYGTSDISFACMCASQEEWQKWMADAVYYSTHVLGTDGVYLDQMSMAHPNLCFVHDHPFNSWNEGYEAMLSRIHSMHVDNPLGIIYEGVSDIHGHQAAGQLISTFAYHCSGAFPEMYKYTFPEQILVDMVYPKQYQMMRPSHISLASTDIINRAFVTGAYYWVYDLEMDNTFRLDPEQYRFLKDCISLRRLWLDRFDHGTYRDTRGLSGTTRNISVKRFDTEKGILLACANPEQQKDLTVILEPEREMRNRNIQVIDTVSERTVPLRSSGGKFLLEVPTAKLSLIYLEF